MKVCNRCGSTINEFYKCKNRKDGFEAFCKICRNKASQKWRGENPQKMAVYYKRYYLKYIEKIRARKNQKMKEWYSNNKAKKYAYDRLYCIQNRGVRRNAWAKRKAAKLQATPPWVDLFAIRAIYLSAVDRCNKTGIKYEVDHIIPLQGKDVCGLHVPWNLQIITAKENNIKHINYSKIVS